MNQLKVKKMLASTLIILSIPCSVLAQPKLPDPRQEHLSGGSGAGLVVRSESTPGKVSADLNSPYVQDKAVSAVKEAAAWRQGQQVEEESPCAPHLIATSKPLGNDGDNTNVKMDFCVEDVTALDSELRVGVGMPSKFSGDYDNRKLPSCKADVVSTSGVRIWVVSDSMTICSLLISAKTTHPEVSITGYMTSIYPDVVNFHQDKSITLNGKGEDYALIFIGVTSAKFR